MFNKYLCHNLQDLLKSDIVILMFIEKRLLMRIDFNQISSVKKYQNPNNLNISILYTIR